jgi:hypothetical protein
MCGQRIGKTYKVDSFPSSAKHVTEEWMEGRIAIFVPRQVDLIDLNRIFPNLKTKYLANSKYLDEGSPIIDNVGNFGWLWIERSILAPNRDLSAQELEDVFRRQARQGQSLRTYVVGGLMSKFFGGQCFDVGVMGAGRGQECTHSILLGSCINGRPIQAAFNDLNSGLDVRPAIAGHAFDVGGRSEEVIRPRK